MHLVLHFKREGQDIYDRRARTEYSEVTPFETRYHKPFPTYIIVTKSNNTTFEMTFDTIGTSKIIDGNFIYFVTCWIFGLKFVILAQQYYI